MSNSAPHALAVLASPELKPAKLDPKKLQTAAAAQVAAVAKIEASGAQAGILAGLTLHVLKATMPGKFRAWLESEDVNFGSHLTPASRVKTANNYMRLALAFLEKTKVKKALLLDAQGKDGALTTTKALEAKLDAFVDGCSLTELLIRYNIKSVGLKTALTDGDDGDDDELTPAQKMQAAREAIWEESYTAVARIRAALTEPDKIQLLNDPKQLQTLKAEIVEINRLADERLADLTAPEA